MSIQFKRNGKWVELQTFSNNEVIDYLVSKLNADKIRLKLSAMPKLCNVVMAKFEYVNFIIHAKDTFIELSFNIADNEKNVLCN